MRRAHHRFLTTHHPLLLGILLALFLMAGCAPKATVEVAPERFGPADSLLNRAREAAGRKAYEEALRVYGNYLSQFPDHPEADAGLLETGRLYRLTGRPEAARNAFNRLIAGHPKSPLVPDAMLELIKMQYGAGDYPGVIRLSSDLLALPISDRHLFRVYKVLGDTHMALEAPMDAVYYYTMAYHKAGETEKASIVADLKEAIRKVATGDIITLLDRLDDDLPVGYLLYQLGLNEVEAKNYEAASSALAELVDRFPTHENAPDARVLMEELQRNFIYRKDVVGCLLPLSGPYGGIGTRALKGIEFALNRYSQDPDARPLNLVIKDTGADPDRAVQSVRELFEEKAALIIGPIITAEPAAAEAQKLGIPIIVMSQKETLPGMGDYVFRNFLTPRMQVESVLSYAIRDLQLKRFAILYPEENYGVAFMNLFWDQLLTLGGNLVGVESYPTDGTDFADPIKKLVGLYYDIPTDMTRPGVSPDDPSPFAGIYEEETVAGLTLPEGIETGTPEAETETVEDKPAAIVDFDAIFIPDAPAIAGMIIPQLAYYDLVDVYLLGTNLWHSGKLLEMAGEYMQGAILTDGFFPESAAGAVREFVGAYTAVYKETPGFVEAVAYDTARLSFQILGRSDSEFRSALKGELLGVENFPGVTGQTSFDETGEARKKLFLLQIRGKRFVELENGVTPKPETSRPVLSAPAIRP